MPSIINGLFSGRSGIASHGAAIAVVGDNISNSSTIGFKAGRSEFEDLIAGGQTAGKTIGSGSQLAGVSTLFDQGTLEFTGRALDLAIDGNGFFVVGEGDQRFYTRAGNFKVDASGYLVNQSDLRVLGYPASGSGALEEINVNTISQSNIDTNNISITGNLDASATAIADSAIPAAPLVGASGSAVTYTDLNNAAAFSTVVDIFDSLGAPHTMTFFFYKVSSITGIGAVTNTYQARAYVDSGDVDAAPATAGYPRQATISGGTATTGTWTLAFNGDGSLDTTAPTNTNPLAAELALSIAWSNGASTSSIDANLANFTQYSSPGSIKSISQDGQGIGNVTSLAIESDGSIFAKLSNGQTATIGTVGMVNFSNPEGLNRIGKNLLQQAPASGEPIVGRPNSGTFGSVSAGSIELSSVDIANEFVKLITLQRGFQANSRIITTINQLLNEIVQLA